ncbi:MAG: hypothetical protein O3A63_09610 [Proteobacteria bacterium]|nr:hypothetical protein [Pseudomonadota bacterium]
MLRQQWQQKTLTDADGGKSAHSEPGVAWLSDLGVLVFQGNDAAAFLQGYLTCDTDKISSAPGAWAMCDLRGRVVANGYVCGSATQVSLLLHVSLCSTVIEFLRRYMVFSKTTVTDHTQTHLVFGRVDCASDKKFWPIDQRRDLALACDETDAQALAAANPLIDEASFWQSRIKDQLPLLSSPVSGQFLPQMLNLQHAVDFNKGCYLGQEIVARAQHRGQVKRQVKTMLATGTSPLIGQTLTDAAGQKHGTVVNLQAVGADKTMLLVVAADDGATSFNTPDATYSIL